MSASCYVRRLDALCFYWEFQQALRFLKHDRGLENNMRVMCEKLTLSHLSDAP